MFNFQPTPIEKLDTSNKEVAAAIVAVAEASASYEQVTELWSTEDQRYDYARNCVAEAMHFDELTAKYIKKNAPKVIERDLEYA